MGLYFYLYTSLYIATTITNSFCFIEDNLFGGCIVEDCVEDIFEPCSKCGGELCAEHFSSHTCSITAGRSSDLGSNLSSSASKRNLGSGVKGAVGKNDANSSKDSTFFVSYNSSSGGLFPPALSSGGSRISDEGSAFSVVLYLFYYLTGTSSNNKSALYCFFFLY